jgi:hypothetical protein
MSNKHVAPLKDADFLAFCKRIGVVLGKYADQFKYFTKEQLDGYNAHVTILDDAMALIATGQATHAVFARKNTEKKWLKNTTTKIHNFVQAHPFTTDEIRKEFGFAIPKKTRTRSTYPDDSVEGMLAKHPTDHRHIFTYRIRGSEGRGCGGIYKCVELRIYVCAPGEKPPAMPDDYTRREFIRRSPTDIIFPATQAGMIAYYIARFINNAGMPGPWAALESELIP